MKSRTKLTILMSLWSVLSFAAEAGDVELPADSLYRIETSWKNQEGESTPLRNFSGKTVVMTMTYTGCQYSCPMTINKLESIEKDFQKKGVKNYHFVIASFDPEKDTPSNLKSYMQKKKMNTTKWTFLSASSDEEVRKLAVLLDIKYEKIEGGDFSHSNAVTLLGPDGRAESKLPGLSSSHEEFLVKAASFEKKK